MRAESVVPGSNVLGATQGVRPTSVPLMKRRALDGTLSMTIRPLAFADRPL